MSDTARVTLEVDGDGVARLTFDHPRRLNAITAAMWRALPALLDRVEEERTIRVLLLLGAGERAFCTGNDTSEFDAIRADAAQSATYNELQRAVALRMAALSKPAIAAIQGHCLGAGLELALQCDLRFASADARMGVPAVRLGLPYRLEDIAKLVDVVGLASARRLVLTGASVAGGELERLGLVTRLLPDQAAMRAAAAEAAAEIAAAAPLSLRAARRPSSSCRAATRRRTCRARSASPTPATTAPTTRRAGPRAVKAGRRASRGNDDAMRRRPLLASAALFAGHARSQPRGPVRVLVGFAPGGAADQSVRIAADALARRGGPSVVAEARSGALGFLAAQAVSRAAPDGLTLATAIMGMMSVAPAVPGSQIPLDLDRELTPVCNLAGTPMALIVPRASSDRDASALAARARANPGALSYASTGNGSTNQLAAEHFAAEAGGLRLVHVAYRGGAPAVLDVAAGRIDLMFANIAEVVELMRAGQVRGLALAAAQPAPLAPELPLLTREFPALDMDNWFGLVGPAGMPAELVQQLGGAFTEAMSDPATRPVLEARGLHPIPEVGAEFAARIRRDRERWARVAARGNIRAD